MNARQLIEAEANQDYERMRKAWPLHKKRDSLAHERVARVALNQALAQAGIPEQDMETVIVGAQLGRTDNYKRRIPTKVCQSKYCDLRGRPQGDFDECDECGEPLVASTRQLSFSDLHGDMANSIVGVVTKDGRRVFFDQPVPQRPWTAWEREDNPSGPRQRPNLPYGSPRRAIRAGRGY